MKLYLAVSVFATLVAVTLAYDPYALYNINAENWRKINL